MLVPALFEDIICVRVFCQGVTGSYVSELMSEGYCQPCVRQSECLECQCQPLVKVCQCPMFLLAEGRGVSEPSTGVRSRDSVQSG